MRLGGGEYDGNGKMARWEARTLFLDAVAEVQPRVLKDLRGILPLYNEKGIVAWGNVESNLKSALVEWAEKYNIKYNFVYQTAIITLWCWTTLPEEILEEVSDEWQHEAAAYWLPVDRQERKIEFNHTGWNPAGESISGFKKRAEEDFQEYLDDYIAEQKKLIKERDLKKSPKKRKEEHFLWLADYLVNNIKQRDIALKYYDKLFDEDQVINAKRQVQRTIKDLVELLEIELPERQGRPSK